LNAAAASMRAGRDAGHSERPSTRAERQAATRAERQAATREALLRAAMSTICEHGIDGASIDRIAAAAGYTKGAFYANFTSKEQLFLVMLDAKFSDFLTRLEAALREPGDPLDVSRRASEVFLEYVRDDPRWPRLYQEFAVHAARNEPFRAEFAVHQRALRAQLADVFARWTDAQGIEPALPHIDVATMTYFIADGFLLDRIIDPEIDDELYVTVREVFLRGLAAITQEREAQRLLDN
jgi:AcrR family transcriptional regulator